MLWRVRHGNVACENTATQKWQLVNFCSVSHESIICKNQTPGNPLPWHHSSPVLLKNHNILLHSKFWLKATHVTAFCIHIFSSSQTKTIPPSTAVSCCFPCCGSSQHRWKSHGALQTARVLINVLAKKRKKGFANGFAAPISSKYSNVFAFLGQSFEKNPRETWESRMSCWP